MNENAVLAAMGNLISTNAATLVDGLDRQGNPRTIGQITRSSLTPATKYFYIALDVTEVTGQSVPDQNMPRQLQKPIREARYNCVIGITDDAYIQIGEEQPYERLHQDFRLFTDRIVDLIEQTPPFLGPDNQKYELLRTGATSDRVVRKRNLTGTYIEAEGQGEHALFYCQLDFVLVEKCPDPSLLYPS